MWDLDKLTDAGNYQSIFDRRASQPRSAALSRGLRWALTALAADTILCPPLTACAAVAASLLSGGAADVKGLESLLTEKASATISGPGVISVKFAQEGACWVEFTNADLGASGASVAITISENKLPAPLETGAPVQHGHTYRLEPNNQLYEGIHYAFLNITWAAAAKPFTITSLRRGCQVVPTNYNGHFESSDSDLDRIWWVEAYTVRVTLCGLGLGIRICMKNDEFCMKNGGFCI